MSTLNTELSDELFNFIQQTPLSNWQTPVQTDVYKLGHHYMYCEGGKNIMSYDEARLGARYLSTTVVGIQNILKKHFVGKRVHNKQQLDMCQELVSKIMMGVDIFNYQMWERILTHHNGMLPLRICAVKEGSSIPINNVTMTVEATDNTINPITKKGYFLPLVNHFETILTHQWGAQNVATIAKYIYDQMKLYFDETVDEDMHWLLPFMMHDFGYRGVMCNEQAAVAGLGHLALFNGTDTTAAIIEVIRMYGARDIPGMSVIASEHSVMTQKLEVGEFSVLKHIIENTPDGVILSLVADSYDIVKFILEYLPKLEDIIKRKNLKVVIRPDSPRFKNDTAWGQVVWIAKELEKLFGSTTNNKGYKVLNPHFGIIYGDGIGPDDIIRTLAELKKAGFAASTCVFGMGGGLLQKHNRDTQRKAFKCSARETENGWEDVYKNPLDQTKASKRGRLALIKENGIFNTIRQDQLNGRENLLEPVFENGVLLQDENWADIVDRARNG